MDVVLQVFSHLNLINGNLSFNPCFDGCGSSRVTRPLGVFVVTKVSILVLMDVVLQAFLDA